MSVQLDIRDQVAWITLDDGKVNAVGDTLLDGLNAALDTAEREAKAVVLVGRPGKFSAGFDLTVMQGGSQEAIKALLDRGGATALRLLDFPLPTVAVCTGHALAMGALLLLACDTRIGVAGDFKIGLNETAIGMPLPVFGIELPKAMLARTELTAAVVQSRLYNPSGARDAGFLTHLTDADQAQTLATETAGALAALPTSAYVANRRALRRETIDTIRAGLAG